MSTYVNLEDVFSLFDQVGDGKVELSQVGEVLRALGLNPTQKYIKKLLQQFDLSMEERITINEFKSIQKDCEKHQVHNYFRALFHFAENVIDSVTGLFGLVHL